MKINYYTEPEEEYREAIDKATNAPTLVAAIKPFAPIANDALQIAIKIAVGVSKGYSWQEFKKGLSKERKGIFSGDKWAKKYAEILMPLVMFEVSAMASEFQVPWGTAFIRMEEEGTIKKKKGIYYMNYPNA